MSVPELRLVAVAEDYDASVVFFRDVLGWGAGAVAGPGGAEVTILDAGRDVGDRDPAQAAYIDAVEAGRAVAPRLRVAAAFTELALAI